MKGPPETFATIPVSVIKDYRDGTLFDLQSGHREKSISLPSSNVLQFILSEDSIIFIRPSGTEPKIKFYASCCERPTVPLEEAKSIVLRKIETIRHAVVNLIGG